MMKQPDLSLVYSFKESLSMADCLGSVSASSSTTGCPRSVSTSTLVVIQLVIYFTLLLVCLPSAVSTGPVFNSTTLSDNTNASLNMSATITDALPDNWELYCTKSVSFVDWDITTLSRNELKNMLEISCFLDQDNHLYFSALRAWQKARVNLTKVALKVTCGDASPGYFHLPWPMKARNLVYLDVSGCYLPEYYSEYLNTPFTEFPDQLRVLEIRNCTLPMTTTEIFMLANEVANLSMQSECGPLSAEKMVISRLRTELDTSDYDYPEAWASTAEGEEATDEEYVEHNADKLWEDSRRLPYRCDFREMRYLEDSGHDMSGKHLNSVLQNSLYPVLEVLNVSYSNFNVTPREFIEWRGLISSLQYLDLSHNDISDVYFIERGLPQDGIGTIDLQYNSITVLSKPSLDSFDRLESAVIDIRNNPINCSCGAVSDVFAYLQRPNLGHYEYLREMTCAIPESLRGRTLGSLTAVEVECKEPLYVLIGLLTVSVFILVLAIIVIVKYRREVVILVYTRLHIVLPCRPRDTDDTKQYDAFISYSSKDDEWVLRTLVKRLESDQDGSPLKLCVHHRDFELGAAISENVVKSVESSRHTILVLSRHFVESEWCIYEFRTALYQSLLERKKHLIVILLEDVPKNELDPDLRKCLETFTYIQLGDKLFWDKVIYSLTIGKKRNTLKSSPISQYPEKQSLKSLGNNNIV